MIARCKPWIAKQLRHKCWRNMSDEASSFRPVTAAIRDKLTVQLKPFHIQVMNESHMHNVPKNSETHFKVVIVSDEFTAMTTTLVRHRKVHEILKAELDGPVHALSIVAKTPAQWQAMVEGNVVIESSPSCRGGDGSLPTSKQE